jgi:hypothetical protein
MSVYVLPGPWNNSELGTSVLTLVPIMVVHKHSSTTLLQFPLPRSSLLSGECLFEDVKNCSRRLFP